LKLILFGIDIFLTARQGVVFAQLVSAINPVEGRKRGRQNHANDEGRTTAVLKNGRENIRRVWPQVAAKVLAHLSLGELSQIFGELLLLISPGEVGIALAEAGFGQLLHHFGASESFRKKGCVRKFLSHSSDQIFPKGDWLGVRIID